MSSSCAGSNGFCGATSPAAIASVRKRSVTKAAVIVSLEVRKLAQMSLSSARPRTDSGSPGAPGVSAATVREGPAWREAA